MMCLLIILHKIRPMAIAIAILSLCMLSFSFSSTSHDYECRSCGYLPCYMGSTKKIIQGAGQIIAKIWREPGAKTSHMQRLVSGILILELFIHRIPAMSLSLFFHVPMPMISILHMTVYPPRYKLEYWMSGVLKKEFINKCVFIFN